MNNRGAAGIDRGVHESAGFSSLFAGQSGRILLVRTGRAIAPKGPGPAAGGKKKRFDGRYRAGQSAVQYLLLGFGTRLAAAGQAGQPADGLPAAAGGTHARASTAITLVDENVEAIDFDRLARADIVGLTGMSVQRRPDARDSRPSSNGAACSPSSAGPGSRSRRIISATLADVIFIGEAEETWPRFLAEWQQGQHAARYEQAERTDMTRVPAPRYDLLKMRHYLFGSVQFSRGCPFQCEFCDIIVTFGRRPG